MMKKNWRPIGSYADNELVVVEFASIAERNCAVDWMCGDAELSGLPWDGPNGMDMFIPKEVAPMLKSKGLQFLTSELAPNSKKK